MDIDIEQNDIDNLTHEWEVTIWTDQETIWGHIRWLLA